MSNPRDQSASAADYKVGYKKPPPGFKKGQPSANPKGRPRKTSSPPTMSFEGQLAEIIVREGKRSIGIRDGDKLVNMETTQAVVRAMALSAIKGNAHAQRTYMEMVAKAEEIHARKSREYLDLWIDYKRQGEEELARRKAAGIAREDDMIPHPDDVSIDYETGVVGFAGPWTKEQKVREDYLLSIKAQITEKIRVLEDPLGQKALDSRLARIFRRELHKSRETLSVIETIERQRETRAMRRASREFELARRGNVTRPA
jgi:hypothetical protein